MGAKESKPEPVRGHFNIYVTNKTKGAKDIYVRLRGDKLQESEVYSRILNETSVEITAGGEAGQGGEKGAKQSGQGGIKYANKHERENKTRQVFSCLTQGGFTYLPPGEVVPFAVENIDRLMYISVHDGNHSWGWDMQVNPQLFGCVTVKEDNKGRISVFPSNPEPHWIQFNKENPSFPSGIVKVRQRSDNVVIYLAKITYFDEDESEPSNPWSKSYLTGVWRENGKLCMDYIAYPEKKYIGILDFTVDLLVAKEYKWAKAQRGNEIPPNAVKAMLQFGKNFEEHCLGRVGGERVSEITITDGMIDHFEDKGKESTSGEILLLTIDSSV